MIDKNSIAGTVLGALRSGRGVTQSVIANYCQRSISYVSSWENGLVDIPNQVVNIYSKYLEIPEKEILELIKFYDIEEEKFYRAVGGNLFYPTFRMNVANILKNKYYRAPLNPRTRTSIKPLF